MSSLPSAERAAPAVDATPPGGSSALDRLGAELLRILREDMYRDVPDARTDLFASGVLDSLTLVDLLVRIEQEMGIRLSLAELEIETLATVEGIAGAVADARSG